MYLGNDKISDLELKKIKNELFKFNNNVCKIENIKIIEQYSNKNIDLMCVKKFKYKLQRNVTIYGKKNSEDIELKSIDSCKYICDINKINIINVKNENLYILDHSLPIEIYSNDYIYFNSLNDIIIEKCNIGTLLIDIESNYIHIEGNIKKLIIKKKCKEISILGNINEIIYDDRNDNLLSSELYQLSINITNICNPFHNLTNNLLLSLHSKYDINLIIHNQTIENIQGNIKRLKLQNCCINNTEIFDIINLHSLELYNMQIDNLIFSFLKNLYGIFIYNCKINLIDIKSNGLIDELIDELNNGLNCQLVIFDSAINIIDINLNSLSILNAKIGNLYDLLDKNKLYNMQTDEKDNKIIFNQGIKNYTEIELENIKYSEYIEHFYKIIVKGFAHTMMENPYLTPPRH
jgi:hypothetical protein